MPIPTVANSSAAVNFQSTNNIVGPNVTSGTYDSVFVTTPPSNGSYNTTTSDIFYSPNPSFDGTDSISYVVHNSSGTSALATVTINVGQATLTSTPASGALSSVVLRDTYSVTFGATGGYPGTGVYPDYTATIVSGAFPTGLSLVNNTLSGTPTVAGAYNFGIKVWDSSDPTKANVTTNYSITVDLPKIELNVTPVVYEGGTVYISWNVNYAGDAIVNVSNGGGTFSLTDQPLTGATTLTAPSRELFDFVTVELRNRSPSTFVTSTSSYYAVQEVLKPLTGPLPSSKYSQTTDQWDKTPITVPPQSEWKQWGLYRSYIGSTVPGWGSDSIQNTEGTVEINYNGQNVDVVVIGRGSPNHTHPEFTDKSGGSRVKYYNWFQWNSTVNGSVPNGTYTDKSYYTQDANAACAVASIVAGNEYGWARGANIYTLDYTLIPSTVDDADAMAKAFEYLNLFQQNKSINSLTGVKNPTIVVTSSMLYRITDPSTAITINYQGSTYGPGTFSTSTLATYNISTPYSNISDSRIFTSYDSSALNSAVTSCIGNGVIVVGPAGDFANYADITTGPDYNNTIDGQYYNRGTGVGSTPGVICVGATDSKVVETEALYSGVGPRVNLFAPGTDIMVAMNSKLGVHNDIVGESPPTTLDPRNSLFSIGKVSGTLYAAAQVAGFLACLAQLQPSLTPLEALSYVTTNAGVNQLSTGSTATIATSSVQLYTSHNGAYCDFLNVYGVWPNQNLNSPAGFGNAGKVSVTFNFNAPLTASTYKLAVSADNFMQVYFNGNYATNYSTPQAFYSPTTYENISLNAGSNTLLCEVYNYHGPGSFGVVIQDAYNNQVFATSPNLNLTVPNMLKGSPNLTLFGIFPVINERVSSVPAVTTNQKFDIKVTGGTPNGAFDYSVKNITTGTGFLNNVGEATIVGQYFDTSGIKNYEFTFINSTNVVKHSVNVIEHNANEIISSFTQTGAFWNKTPEYIVPEPNWLNWGLLRSTSKTTLKDWGSDSAVINASGTVSVPYTGLNVDIIILDGGSVDPSHPEFALYSDGTGGSRVKYFNWLKYNFSLLGVANGNYNDITYYKSIESDKACAIAGIAAGNTYGWARAANIYSLNYNLLPNGSNNIEDAFGYITSFHNSKQINQLTGVINPTLVIAGWSTNSVIPTEIIQQVDYQGTAHTNIPIDQLQQYGVLSPYSNVGNTATYITVRNSAIDAAVATAISAGIVVVSTPGDYGSYVSKTNSDANWNNRILDNAGRLYFYNRGASPGAADGVICVGAIDSTVAQQKAGYSGNGPRVDVFAPGSDQISAESSIVGIYSDITGMYSPTYTDPRNNNYFIGKGAGTAYAAANVAGYAACLLQLYPTSTSTDILNLVTGTAIVNELVIDNVGFGINNDLNGAPNRLLHATFPNYNEVVYTSVNGSSSTSVSVGDNFDFHITNADPGSRFYFSGTGEGSGVIDQYGNATATTIALKNTGLYVYRFYFASTNHTQVVSFRVTTSASVSNKDIIYANDYNRVQNRINYLLSNTYGKTPASSQRSPGMLLTATNWQAMYSDIQSAYVHQNGQNAEFPLDYPISGAPVTAIELNNMTSIIDNLINDYATASPDQLYLYRNSTSTIVTTAIYESLIQTYTWTTSSGARHFFNLGGYFEVSVENPTLGKQTGVFTLTDYISSYGYMSLPIPGGYLNSILSVDQVNGNTATIKTIVAPNLGNTAISTSTIRVYASTDANGGIASPVPVTTSTLVQGQLNVTPIRYVPIYGNTITTSTFNVYNNYGSEITVSEIRINPDPNRKPLDMIVNTKVPFVVTSTYSLSVSFQNVEPGGDPGLYENSIELVSNGPNPLLIVPVPVQANFGIVVKPNPYFRTVTKPTTSTFEVVSYAGTYTSYTVIATAPSTGFQVINPGINYTYYTLDDSIGKITMGLLLYNYILRGRRAPSTTGALSSPYKESILVTDVGAVPNLSTSTQLQVVAYPKDITQNAATALVDVEMLVDSKDYHIGHWISPQNKMNGVIGFSYDVIDGRRCLTVGFGMGGGGSGLLYQSDQIFETTVISQQGYGLASNYAIQQLGRKFYTQISTATASTALAGWNTATINTSTFNTYTETLVYSPDELVPLSTSSNNSNAFLSTYGVWNGAGADSPSCVSSGTFLARDGGEYSYYFNCAAKPSDNTVSASFSIDGGSAISSISESSGIVNGRITLSPGLHEVNVNATQSSSADDAFPSVALTIIDSSGYVVWCTLDPMPPTWAEVGRVFLEDDGKPHSYQVMPNVYSTNIANNTTYSTYFNNNSIVTVNDNGSGQLSITLNPVSIASQDSITDATLSNVPYLFYYYSNAENQIEGNKRYNNFQAAGQYVKYFTGFNPYGNVTTVQRLAPGYIAPPTIITQYYGNTPGKKSVWKSALELVLLVTVGLYAIFAVTVIYGILVAGGTLTLAAFSWSAFLVWVGELTFCFTGDTKVTMADGTVKNISDVKVGEYVYNHDKTSINKVKYLEVTVNKELVALYSPDKNLAPFATLNHPLYINGTLSSVKPDLTYECYPWLGKPSQLIPARSGPMHPGELMYNIQLDGDHTFIVNGYGTHSISGDGGALRVAIEHGYLSQDRVQEMFQEYIDAGTEVAYGGWLFNKYLGKVLELVKFKFVTKLIVKSFDKPADSKFRLAMNKVFKFIGKQAIKRQEKQAKK